VPHKPRRPARHPPLPRAFPGSADHANEAKTNASRRGRRRPALPLRLGRARSGPTLQIQAPSHTLPPPAPPRRWRPAPPPQVHRQRLGEIAEAFFLAKAADLGFTVLKPWGDSEAYDFVLDAHHGRGAFSRVQVKSAHRKAPDRGYSFSAHDFSLHAYSERDVDAFIAYVVPEDIWYVIPIRDLKKTDGIHLFPTSKRRSKYEKYRDAWWHLEK
jgi:hypothetical protein